MATFDEAGRQACKVSGPGLVSWLERFAEEPLEADFVAWDDARRSAWPGGPERTDDVVCILRRRADRKPARLVVEVATEPRADDLARLGVYELLLAIEVRAVLEDGPPVHGAIIHLTGSAKGGPLRLTKSEKKPGVLVEPIKVWLADESAAGTLDLIEAGEVALCILPWVVLMRGGGELALIRRWKQLAEREQDLERRVLYRAIALVFAELIRELVNWQQALEGWEVRESQYLKSFEAKGAVKQARAYLIRVLEAHLQSAAPEPIRLAIEGTNDLSILNRWFDAALTVASWADFQAVMKQG